MPNQKSSVYVIGDTILDHYFITEPSSRVNPDKPNVPIFDLANERYYIGGAGNVAIAAAAVKIPDEDTHVTYVTGLPIPKAPADKDKDLVLLSDTLRFMDLWREFTCHSSTELNLSPIQYDGGGLTKKIRTFYHRPYPTANISPYEYVSRIDRDIIGESLCRTAQHHIQYLPTSHAPVVVISDYDKGAIRQPRILIDDILKDSNSQATIIVDGKKPWKEYSGASILKVNVDELMSELERALRGFILTNETYTLLHEILDELEAKDAEGLRDLVTEDSQRLLDVFDILLTHADIKYLIVTMGDYGALLYGRVNATSLLQYFSLEEFPPSMTDPSGAGDVFVGTFAAALSDGYSKEHAIKLANKYASRSVHYIGPLYAQLGDGDDDMTHTPYIKALDHVVPEIQDDERIVFTNGCFDGLHMGHIDFLERAKKLGERLIVGLNSDRSLQRIKGREPFLSEAYRKKGLESLKAVDYVIIFDEDTPEDLIKALDPDYLVKGGDYMEKPIVGREFVESRGGVVLALPFAEATRGFGSTNPKG